jgi:glycerol transport system ATP-binding protein
MTLRLRGIGRDVAGKMWLDGIDLTLEPGGLYVILGRTLAGKTSLLRILAGLDRPSRGRFEQDERSLLNVPVRKRDIAFVYQQFVNYPSFSVFNNIAAPLRRKGLGRDEIDRRVREAARIVHIDGMLDRLPQHLSGGQQQRLAIARALVKRAGLLLLDEPLVNLDYKLREELRADLRTIFRGADHAVVYTTTEPDEALQIGGTTIVMHEGRVLQVGPAAEIYRNPCSTTVAEVFSDPPINIVAGDISGGLLAFSGAKVPLPAHMQGAHAGACRLGLMPHRVLETPSRGSVELKGKVLLTEVDGSSTFTHLELEAEEWIMQRDGIHPKEPGTPCSVHVNPAEFYLFDAEGSLLTAPGARSREVA